METAKLKTIVPSGMDVMTMCISKDSMFWVENKGGDMGCVGSMHHYNLASGKDSEITPDSMRVSHIDSYDGKLVMSHFERQGVSVVDRERLLTEGLLSSWESEVDIFPADDLGGFNQSKLAELGIFPVYSGPVLYDPSGNIYCGSFGMVGIIKSGGKITTLNIEGLDDWVTSLAYDSRRDYLAVGTCYGKIYVITIPELEAVEMPDESGSAISAMQFLENDLIIGEYVYPEYEQTAEEMVGLTNGDLTVKEDGLGKISVIGSGGGIVSEVEIGNRIPGSIHVYRGDTIIGCQIPWVYTPENPGKGGIHNLGEPYRL